MKILIVHNDYGRYSGEEAVVNKMGEMMLAHGHEINFFRADTAAHQHGLRNKIRVFLSGIYSYKGVRSLRQALRTLRPDIVNIHNLYPFISPAALFACRAAGIPVVMTVHNYRLVCPTGLFLRDGRPCEHCLEKGNEFGCVRFNCEHNLFKSLAYALRSFTARKTGAYQRNVDRYVCVTAFQKQKLVQAGFSEEKITVIPNSIPLPAAGSTIAGEYIAYVGRLSHEKGWDLLMDVALQHPQLQVHMAGFDRDQAISTQLPPNVSFAGYLDTSALREFYRQAKFVVIPSRCYEGFPLVALEALSMGKPVIAPDHGGFTEIIGKGELAVGCLFQPGDQDDLGKEILRLWEDERLVREMGKRGREKFRKSYSSEMIYRQWEELLMDLQNINQVKPIP